MLELHTPGHLPLQLASRLLPAPGIWAPGSRLALAGLGALVTPPLGWAWDGDALPWQAHPGAFHWSPPRRPVDRFPRRLARESHALPRLFTLAPDSAQGLAQTLDALAEEEAAGYLLWAATPDSVAAARRAAPALPLLAELPVPAAPAQAVALVEAGADGIWLGPPVAGERRLWGPAILPLMEAALAATRPAVTVPLIAGAGIASVADALTLRAAGAELLALGPAWWVQPDLAAQVLTALNESAPSNPAG